MSEKERIIEEELVECPECGGKIETVKPIISYEGEGNASSKIACRDCDFRAREKWTHEKTIVTQSGGGSTSPT